MPDIKVFDPPMCCSTGVCGPDEDDIPAQFASALEWAKKQGASVDRYNLAQQPSAFAQDAKVKGLLESDGVDCLPLVFVDGEVLTKAGYPSRAEIADKLGLEAAADSAPEEKAAASGGCCG